MAWKPNDEVQVENLIVFVNMYKEVKQKNVYVECFFLTLSVCLTSGSITLCVNVIWEHNDREDNY